jgi:hypothetical protein
MTRQTLDFINVHWCSDLHTLQLVNWPTLNVTKYTTVNFTRITYKLCLCFDFHAVYSAARSRAKFTHVYICVPKAHPDAYTNITGLRITSKSLF